MIPVKMEGTVKVGRGEIKDRNLVDGYGVKSFDGYVLSVPVGALGGRVALPHEDGLPELKDGDKLECIVFVGPNSAGDTMPRAVYFAKQGDTVYFNLEVFDAVPEIYTMTPIERARRLAGLGLSRIPLPRI